jgi:hypothetical protein
LREQSDTAVRHRAVYIHEDEFNLSGALLESGRDSRNACQPSPQSFSSCIIFLAGHLNAQGTGYFGESTIYPVFKQKANARACKDGAPSPSAVGGLAFDESSMEKATKRNIVKNDQPAVGATQAVPRTWHR